MKSSPPLKRRLRYVLSFVAVALCLITSASARESAASRLGAERFSSSVKNPQANSGWSPNGPALPVPETGNTALLLGASVAVMIVMQRRVRRERA